MRWRSDAPLSDRLSDRPPLRGMDYEQVAYHEAGHAVMAWLCGWRLRKVSTVPDGETNGRVSCYPIVNRGKSVWDASMEKARVDVAGGVACCIKLGLFDTQNMRRWVQCSNAVEFDKLMPAAWLDDMLIRARNDLQANWPRVEDLVAELQDKWWLWGKRATAVIEGATPPS